MRWGMEILSPTSYLSNSSWLLEESKSGNWTPEENKKFENALALHDKDTPDRWHNVAAMIPGKTVEDVISHYRDLEDDISDIEAGRIPIPGYSTSSFTVEWVNDRRFDVLKPTYAVGGKRTAGRPDQERKKGVPWTEDEHRRFLIGLKKYGKGDWRNISRNLVITRTPTQVASHAQKYFIRQCSGGKDKRRSSIHDITTVNLSDSRPPSPSQSSTLSVQSSPANVPKTADQFSMSFDSNRRNEGAPFFSPTTPQTHGNPFMPHSYGMPSYGLKMQAQNYQRGTLHESVGPQNSVFQLQSSHHHRHG
ncbi:transcription factor DIVARICATA [Magnolia sinica]|uniref:transcription factor DIVARICATA n=1 Tax=Magnolia sinica TaxID=86752 RepID=UPI0026583F0F|nr:transcription factor DIVARICATA [Magnolia sinica]